MLGVDTTGVHSAKGTWTEELTLLLLVTSFLRSPMAAMLAKYWMTLLVLTVFPAPDSPLGEQQ